MVARRRKKSRKLRGRTRTMGWGRIGQHRKSGSRGGRGAVGFHKHKWSWTVKYAPDWYGKHGFTRPQPLSSEPKTINVGELVEKLEELRNLGSVREEDGLLVLDLAKAGYTKLLGSGDVSVRVKVLVPNATKRAVEKIRSSGGEVILTRERSG
ncbi:MAG: uL15 family ribosomal protein [Fervidicoccaceae archaeon]